MKQQYFVGGVEQLAAIRSFVTHAAKDLGANEDDIFACELSVDEAASNAFEHAYGERGGTVQIKMWREGSEIILSLLHWGEAFEPENIPEPNLASRLEERNIGGLGLYLMRQMMDAVAFHFDPVTGNLITMRRKLGQAHDRDT